MNPIHFIFCTWLIGLLKLLDQRYLKNGLLMKAVMLDLTAIAVLITLPGPAVMLNLTAMPVLNAQPGSALSDLPLKPVLNALPGLAAALYLAAMVFSSKTSCFIPSIFYGRGTAGFNSSFETDRLSIWKGIPNGTQ